MRKLAAVAIASTFVAGLAAAQMKVPAGQQPQTSTSPVQILMSKPQPQQAAAAADPALESARRIPREEAIKLVKENKAIFVDVRSKESYVAEHIKGALNFPLSELPARMGELPKNKMIITYCAWVQEHTSARAVLDLNAKGVKNTAALLGGWTAWKTAQGPVETMPVKK